MTVSQLRLRLRGTIERQLGDYIWEATGKQVEGMWEIIEGRIWQTIGRCEPQGQVEDNWERIGTPHLEQTGGQFGDNWKTTSARQTQDNCVRSGRKNLKDNTSSLLEDQFWRQLGIVEDNWKTIRRPHLGNNWETTGAHGFRRRPCREFQETVLFIEKMFRDRERISGRQLGYHILETKWETSGKHLGDNVGDKVPSFLEPCTYMGKEGEVRLQKGGRQSARHPSSLLSSILVI